MHLQRYEKPSKLCKISGGGHASQLNPKDTRRALFVDPSSHPDPSQIKIKNNKGEEINLIRESGDSENPFKKLLFYLKSGVNH